MEEKGGVIRRKEGRKESWIDHRWKDGSNEGRNSEVKMEERTNGWKNEEQTEGNKDGKNEVVAKRREG